MMTERVYCLLFGNTSGISREDCNDGLTKLLKGDLFKLVFRLYDFNDDDIVERENLSMIWNNSLLYNEKFDNMSHLMRLNFLGPKGSSQIVNTRPSISRRDSSLARANDLKSNFLSSRNYCSTAESKPVEKSRIGTILDNKKGVYAQMKWDFKGFYRDMIKSSSDAFLIGFYYVVKMFKWSCLELEEVNLSALKPTVLLAPSTVVEVIVSSCLVPVKAPKVIKIDLNLFGTSDKSSDSGTRRLKESISPKNKSPSIMSIKSSSKQSTMIKQYKLYSKETKANHLMDSLKKKSSIKNLKSNIFGRMTSRETLRGRESSYEVKLSTDENPTPKTKKKLDYSLHTRLIKPIESKRVRSNEDRNRGAIEKLVQKTLQDHRYKNILNKNSRNLQKMNPPRKETYKQETKYGSRKIFIDLNNELITLESSSQKDFNAKTSSKPKDCNSVQSKNFNTIQICDSAKFYNSDDTSGYLTGKEYKETNPNEHVRSLNLVTCGYIFKLSSTADIVPYKTFLFDDKIFLYDSNGKFDLQALQACDCQSPSRISLDSHRFVSAKAGKNRRHIEDLCGKCLLGFLSTVPSSVINLTNSFYASEGYIQIKSDTFFCFCLFHNYHKQYYLSKYIDEEFSEWKESLERVFGGSSQLKEKAHEEFNVNETPLVNGFYMESLIGEGKFSAVYRCYKKERFYAMKLIKKGLMDKMDLVSTRKEITILKMVSHKDIIAISDCFESFKHIYLIMEYLPCVNLFEYFKRKSFKLGEEFVRKLIRKLIHIISYLRTLGIVHRDLKPENILMVQDSKEPELKLIDFGLARFLAKGELIVNEPFGTLVSKLI